MSWIEKVEYIGDFVISVVSSYATIPWAAVSLVLQMAISDSKRYATVLEGMELTSCIIAGYAIVEEVYFQHSSNAAELLKQAISKLYAKILMYPDGARQYYSRDTISGLLRVLFRHQSTVSSILSKRSSLSKSLLTRLIDADRQRLGFQEARDTSVTVQQNLKQLRKVLADMEQPLQTAIVQVSVLTTASYRSKQLS